MNQNLRFLLPFLLFILIGAFPQILIIAVILFIVLLIIKEKYKITSPQNLFTKIFQKNTKSTSSFYRNATEVKPDSNNPNIFTPMQNFKISTSQIVFICIALIVSFIVIDGLVSVPPGEVGVIYDRGRGVLEDELPEGLHLKIPFWQVAYIMDTRLQNYTMSVAPTEGEYYGDDSIESLTKDGQKILVDVSIQYRLKAENAPWVFKTIGLDYTDKVIRPGARNVIRDVITGYDSTELFTQTTREEAQNKMEEQLSSYYGESRIELESALLRNIQFSDVYLQAIEDKQVAQQRIQKAEYEKLEAEKIKEKKIIEAEAEAESIRLKGETLKANPQVIQFELVQKIGPGIQWGVLPSDILPLIDVNGLKAN